MFEELSGSSVLKPQADDYKDRIAMCDDSLKRDTEALQTLRLEKVKQKGLQEFAEQLNDCLKDQKQTEKQLHLAEILLSDKTILDLQSHLAEYEDGLAKTEQAKTSLLGDLKKYEVENRKLLNNEEEHARKAKNKREELLVFQSKTGDREKNIEGVKNTVR